MVVPVRADKLSMVTEVNKSYSETLYLQAFIYLLQMAFLHWEASSLFGLYSPSCWADVYYSCIFSDLVCLGTTHLYHE